MLHTGGCTLVFSATALTDDVVFVLVLEDSDGICFPLHEEASSTSEALLDSSTQTFSVTIENISTHISV